MPASPSPALRLHRFERSGHCHRVQLLLSLLRPPHELVEVDLALGEHKRPAFLALNPFGQVVAHAPEGGVPLDPYPRIRAWLSTIEALPDFVPMPSSPAAAAGSAP